MTFLLRPILGLSFGLGFAVTTTAVLLNDWPLTVYAVVANVALLAAALALVTDDHTL